MFERLYVPPVMIKRLDSGKGLPLPAYKSKGAACFDFHAAIPEGKEIRLHPHERVAIPLGFALEIPEGFELQLRARSGFAFNHGVGLINGIGTIDADYRDELQALMICYHGRQVFSESVQETGPDAGGNLWLAPLIIRRGDRVVQGALKPVFQPKFIEIDELSATDRKGGLGSTGR